MKLIRRLVAHADQKLVRVNAGDPNHQHNGERTIAWHFSTDRSHHYMIDADGMYDGTTKNLVVQIDAPEM